MNIQNIIRHAWGITLLLSAFSLQPSAFAQGSLTPPGAPAPAMKTLAQIEPRTPISSAPFTISVPGSYYLTTNLTTTVSNAISIAANDVTLDLNGFTISSTVASASAGGSAILLNSGLSDLAIFNGHIRGGVTNNGSGVYSGSGFQHGINYSVTLPVNTRVAGVSVTGCSGNGIYLGYDDSTVVDSCAVRTVGGFGICASTIKSSIAVDCGFYAIVGTEVTDSRGQCTGNATGLTATTAQNCYGSSNGDGVDATTALNCYGTSTGSYGISTRTAQNCYGYSSSGGTGLYAFDIAQNCYGYSGGSGMGLVAFDVAIGCSGYSSSGTGLYAYIANSCRVLHGTTNITYKYNMP
jgi:hypothetical protein